MGPGLLELLLLGAIQGLAEFLPISSSGHLVLTEQWLGVEVPGASLEAWLHLGTLGAVVAALGPDVRSLVRGVASMWPGRSRGPDAPRERGLAIAVILGTVPAVVVALLFADPIEALFEDRRAALLGLLGTGAMLLASRWIRPGRLGLHGIGPGRAILVGAAQALAIVPGVSRSGSTIVAGLLAGVEGEAAARFSFLLSLPAVAGAMAFQGVRHGLGGLSVGVAVGGLVASFAFGVVAIRMLLPIARRGRLEAFGYYCLAVGILGFLS